MGGHTARVAEFSSNIKTVTTRVTLMITFEIFNSKMPIEMILIIAWNNIFKRTVLTFVEVIIMSTKMYFSSSFCTKTRMTIWF